MNGLTGLVEEHVKRYYSLSSTPLIGWNFFFISCAHSDERNAGFDQTRASLVSKSDLDAWEWRSKSLSFLSLLALWSIWNVRLWKKKQQRNCVNPVTVYKLTFISCLGLNSTLPFQFLFDMWTDSALLGQLSSDILQDGFGRSVFYLSSACGRHNYLQQAHHKTKMDISRMAFLLFTHLSDHSLRNNTVKPEMLYVLAWPSVDLERR